MHYTLNILWIFLIFIPGFFIDEFILTPGDLLYIPSYQYHKVDTIGPRILISIHFKNKKEQSLDKFKITTINQNNRPKWYDWSPVKQKINKSTPARRMNKARWSKPYFNKLWKQVKFGEIQKWYTKTVY